MQSQLSRFVLFSPILFIILFLAAIKFSGLVFSATADHLVISEVQIGLTGASNNEFIELYNPTGSSIDISGWVVTKKTAAGTTQDILATIPASTSIVSHGYYLIAHDEYTGSVPENLTYTTDEAISASNTIYLKTDETVIDKLGLGTANDSETQAKGNPPATGSVERKANASSTGTTMIGVDALLGNGEDSDNNFADFVNRAASDPQNASSALEPVAATPSPSSTVDPSLTPVPTASPTIAPTVVPSVSPTVTPTVAPSVAPSASPVVTPSPTPVVTPSPTVVPTVIPTVAPTTTPTIAPSLMPSPSASASASPSATPRVIAVFPFLDKIQVCTLSSRPIRIGFFTFHMPTIDCFFKSL